MQIEIEERVTIRVTSPIPGYLEDLWRCREVVRQLEFAGFEVVKYMGAGVFQDSWILVRPQSADKKELPSECTEQG